MNSFAKLSTSILGCLLLFIACNSNSSPETKEMQLADINMALTDSAAAPAPMQDINEKEVEEEKQAPNNPSSSSWVQKIIKTGSMRVRVKHLGDYENWVKQKVKSVGGYLSSEEQRSFDADVQKSMVIKVPAARFEELVGAIGQQGAELLEKNISAQDVSEEYYDLTTRMASKKKILQQYLDILSKAKKVSEILEVQAEINRIQEELESVEGRARYLSQQSALSTLTLNIETSEKNVTLEPGYGSKLWKEMKSGWEFVKQLLLGVVGVWPIWVMVGLGVVGWRKWRRKRK